MKLTNDQIESIRAVSPELAEKLEAGEKVTVERAIEKWYPKYGDWYACTDGQIIRYSGDIHAKRYNEHGVQRQTKEAAERLARDQRIFNRLHAYRDEFAPGYVVPDIGVATWAVWRYGDAWSCGQYTTSRVIGAVYMPEDVARDLCRKLNSGEVVL